MALTNVEKQRRFRERRKELAGLAIAANDIDAVIMDKLVNALGLERVQELAKAMPRLIAEHLERHPCEKCGGGGGYVIKKFKCGGKTPCQVTQPFPCPACRPEEYAIASGVKFRNEGRYVEALEAALKVDNLWAAGDTLIAWGASPKEVRSACHAAGVNCPTLKDLARLRDIAKARPPGKRYFSFRGYMEAGTTDVDLPPYYRQLDMVTNRG